MKFLASYSGGKDSILALYRAVKQGHTPLFLLTTYNTDVDRSFFHGIPEKVLQSVADSLGIPLLLVKTDGPGYQAGFEEALLQAKAQGAEACVFGDIDIEEHRLWPSERCEHAGLKALFPLWGENRTNVTYEFIDSGFIADIVVVNTRLMPAEYLGRRLSRETADYIAEQGYDVCGENGEYHSFVSGGPMFNKPVDFTLGSQVQQGDYAILPVQAS